MTLCPDDNFGKCPVCGGVGNDNSSPGSAFSTYAVPANLVSNGNFVDGVISDWTHHGGTDSDGAVELETTIIKNAYSAKVSAGTGVLGDYIYQDIHEAEGISYWQGKKITLYCWVWCDVANRAVLNINDGVASIISTYHQGGSNWELLKITCTINSLATQVRVMLRVIDIGGNTVGYFEGAALAENEDVALAVLDRILRESKADLSSSVVIETGKGYGYKLEYYQGELMCQMCIKRKKKEAEDDIATARRREEQELRDRFGFRKSMQD